MLRVTRTIPLVIGLAALAGPAAAHAGTVTLDGGNLTYTASPGVSNGTYITREYGSDPSTISVQDAGEAVTSSDPRCELQSNDAVVCTGVTGTIAVNLGDRDDSFGQPSGDEISNPLVVHGGAGSDKMEAWNRGSGKSVLFGDEGSDKLTGHDGDDEIHGGAGDDTIDGFGGSDALYGDDGNDAFTSDDASKDATPDLIDGGAGADTISGWTRPGNDNPPINISLDGVANDGRPGEGDNVVNVERMTSNVSGTFSFSDADDLVNVYANVDQGASKIATLGGNDVVAGGNFDETIDAGAGNDRIDAGYGNDTITGGPGKDTIYADKAGSDCGVLQSCNLPQGNDTVYAQDGEADTISCGVGTDTVFADAIDTVAPDCETVNRGGAAAGQSGAKGATGTNGSGTGSGSGTTDGAGRTKPALTISARRRGGKVVVSGKLPSSLKGRTVGLALVAKGRTIATKSAKVGSSGRFTARLATHGKRKLTLKATVAATKTTTAVTKSCAVR